MTRFPQPADAATFYMARAQSGVNNTGSTGRTREEYENWRQEVDGYESTDWFDFDVAKSPAAPYYFDVGASGSTEAMNFYAFVARFSENAVFGVFNENGRRVLMQDAKRGEPGNRGQTCLKVNASPKK